MKESALALLILLFLSLVAYGQAVIRAQQSNRANIPIAQPDKVVTDENTLAARSIAAVKRLEKDVLVYRSLGEFEANGRLARISFAAFADHLAEASADVEPMLSRLPKGRLKTEISNALGSYRDGAFWWGKIEKIDQPRVVQVSALTANDSNRTPSETAFLATVPYTVAIHWRQAGRYLKRAEQLMGSSTRN